MQAFRFLFHDVQQAGHLARDDFEGGICRKQKFLYVQSTTQQLETVCASLMNRSRMQTLDRFFKLHICKTYFPWVVVEFPGKFSLLGMYNKREICGVGTGAPGTENALHQTGCIERAADYREYACLPQNSTQKKNLGRQQQRLN